MQLGQQRTVIERQRDQLQHQQVTFDADKTARVPLTPPLQDAGGHSVDLRVGNKPETFTGEMKEWKC